jgi:uncharacterized protein involved in response to NO
MKPAASFTPIGEPKDEHPKVRHPLFERFALFRLGFRPLYLLAAVFAALSVPLWLLAYSGAKIVSPNVNFMWHIHEMVFGFAAPVVVGFLFTAARNWTGLWTPRNWRLGIIVGIWLVGRLSMLAQHSVLFSVLDLLFLPASMIPLIRVMCLSGKRRNLPLVGLLGMLVLANGLYHANLLGITQYSGIRAIEAAILVLAVLSTIMGGRVIPGFTTNMALGSKPRTFERLDKVSVVLIIVASLSWVVGLASLLTAVLATASGLVQLVRLSFWSPHRTAKYPLLWILHLAYAWLGVGYLLLAAAELGITTTSTAIHAIAVGGMSSLILGMITRTTIGHTGRLMRADHKEFIIFWAIQCAALARIVANFTPRHLRDALLIVAGATWAIAFVIYVILFGPFLCGPRLDGRDG